MILTLKRVEPAIFGFNFIKAHEIVIVAVLIKVQLELLIKFDVVDDWSFVEIIRILEIYAFYDEILCKDQMVQKRGNFSV